MFYCRSITLIHSAPVQIKYAGSIFYRGILDRLVKQKHRLQAGVGLVFRILLWQYIPLDDWLGILRAVLVKEGLFGLLHTAQRTWN